MAASPEGAGPSVKDDDVARRSENEGNGVNLSRIAREQPDRLAEVLAAVPLRRQAELALALEPQDRLEVLLHAPKPMRLVRALPPGELYLTVRETGPTDALPLLALAAPRQIVHLMDLEAWRGDRFDARRSGAWAAVLLEAGEPAIRAFLRHADDALLALLVHQWLRVEPIEMDDTPPVKGPGESETGDERGFVSPDGYYRFSPLIEEHGPAAQSILRIFFSDQPARYRQVLWSSRWELPAELEEQALRWRQSRLEEYGFLPWDEAIEVYAPPAGGDVRPVLEVATGDDVLPAPRAPLKALEGRGFPLAALDRLDDAGREGVLAELASLANRVLVADSADPGDPRQHRAALEKVAGYVRIALDRRGIDDAASAARTITEVSVLELFREGHEPLARLQSLARRMVREGWAAREGRALELLDSPLRERVLGLLEPRPMYVDLAAGPRRHALRDFHETSEVEETERAVRMAQAIGDMFERLGLAPETFSGPDRPRFSTLLMTMLAWQATERSLRCEPLPQGRVADFLRNVVSRRTAPPDAPLRAWRALLAALLSRQALNETDVPLIDAFARACLEQLSTECGSLEPGTPVDPRFVSSLLLESGS